MVAGGEDTVRLIFENGKLHSGLLHAATASWSFSVSRTLTSVSAEIPCLWAIWDDLTHQIRGQCKQVATLLQVYLDVDFLCQLPIVYKVVGIPELGRLVNRAEVRRNLLGSCLFLTIAFSSSVYVPPCYNQCLAAPMSADCAPWPTTTDPGILSQQQSKPRGVAPALALIHHHNAAEIFGQRQHSSLTFIKAGVNQDTPRVFHLHRLDPRSVG